MDILLRKTVDGTNTLHVRITSDGNGITVTTARVSKRATAKQTRHPKVSYAPKSCEEMVTNLVAQHVAEGYEVVSGDLPGPSTATGSCTIAVRILRERLDAIEAATRSCGHEFMIDPATNVGSITGTNFSVLLGGPTIRVNAAVGFDEAERFPPELIKHLAIAMVLPAAAPPNATALASSTPLATALSNIRGLLIEVRRANQLPPQYLEALYANGTLRRPVSFAPSAPNEFALTF